MKITTVELLLKYLEGEGVEYIFGVPGLSLVPFFDACELRARLDYL
ncbi:MAG TPA: thiamine pyrophosphate-binding protein [Desulfobacteria bacterium]|nr:thiamine pyrophosphate-binding protein [Desulfobacteria bacterium]